MAYSIKDGIIGSNAVWNVVSDEGEVVASLHGPMSGIVCLAAVEALNKGFDWDGWTNRLSVLTERLDND